MACLRTALALSCLLSPAATQAQTFTATTPDFDRWNYPFNFTPGVRTAVSTFGAVGAEAGMFDDRDAQFLIGFDTSAFAASLPALTGSKRYLVTSATLTATTSSGEFAYDPTYDSYTTYTTGGVDADAGRPVELSGAGVRNFAGFGFGGGASPPPFYAEGSTFGFGDPTAEGIRNAFAADATGGDISNNIRDAFDHQPFAIGATDSLAPGETVVAGTTLEFDIDTDDADIQAYLLSGLPTGLFFSITSLHAASQGGPTVFPAFFTRENTDAAAVPATLSLTVITVPEPSAMLLAMGPGLLPLYRSRRRQAGTKR